MVKHILRQNCSLELFNKTLLASYVMMDPSWVNYEIKTMIKRKNLLFQSQSKSGNLDFAIFKSLTLDILNEITSLKLKYHEPFRISSKILKQPHILICR